MAGERVGKVGAGRIPILSPMEMVGEAMEAIQPPGKIVPVEYLKVLKRSGGDLSRFTGAELAELSAEVAERYMEGYADTVTTETGYGPRFLEMKSRIEKAASSSGRNRKEDPRETDRKALIGAIFEDIADAYIRLVFPERNFIPLSHMPQILPHIMGRPGVSERRIIVNSFGACGMRGVTVPDTFEVEEYSENKWQITAAVEMTTAYHPVTHLVTSHASQGNMDPSRIPIGDEFSHIFVVPAESTLPTDPEELMSFGVSEVIEVPILRKDIAAIADRIFATNSRDPYEAAPEDIESVLKTQRERAQQMEDKARGLEELGVVRELAYMGPDL